MGISKQLSTLTGSQIILLGFNVITFHSKVKDEEKFLGYTFGEKYAQYKKEVGRYFTFPLIKRNKEI